VSILSLVYTRLQLIGSPREEKCPQTPRRKIG
jgi:hypothetical protein